LKSFIDNELKLDLKYFGYMEYAYGLEKHRELFHKILIRDHQLDDYLIKQDQFQVGCFMNSTRLLMFDLGRFIIKELQNNKQQRQPIVRKSFFISNQVKDFLKLISWFKNYFAVSFEPGWDYTGVYQSLDMKVIHLPLTPENKFEPDLNQWSEKLKEENVDYIDLVIINTQHNPT
jgi:hypothetical protein